MKYVIVDTDVILDFLFGREFFPKDSSNFLALCKNKSIMGFLTPVMICNLYYFMRKTNSHKNVIDRLAWLLTFIEVLITGKDAIEQSLISDFKEFEDAVQNFSAFNHKKIDTIITRNLKDYKASTLKVLAQRNSLKYFILTFNFQYCHKLTIPVAN